MDSLVKLKKEEHSGNVCKKMCACFISPDVFEWTTMIEAGVIYKVQGDPRQEQIPEVKLKNLP